MSQNTSFIRWAGGKSWLVPYVKELIEGLDYNNYFEPFMGGASIFFSMENPHQSYLSDVNQELVKTFCAVRDNPLKIIKHLKEYRSDEESYYKIRSDQPKGKYKPAARFLYLNANSFNGIYRVNRQGQYNVPYGKKEKTVNYERLKEISVKLQNVNIQCQDFFDIRDNIQERDLVFLDPPYTVSNNKNDYFIQYNQKLFSLDDQRRLATLIEYIVNHNAWFILTNAHNKTIHNIFSGIAGTREIERERKSLIGGRAAFRGNVQEYIFTNIPERN
ncbi:MAG: Dam family site-specific DNA-(adenine-N6)-methyltransferase [Ruminococcus sp.]|uniref:DNA adenine methylase n=1 Tax=Ruminococcus sp. TaxID=41978 RepID=UPI0025EA7875|nr:Dam family site-specific DNA-(adenine-N6)-methyltransferase [Ruminococcus sp.]MBR0530128.1 Dam family site-specific DNA-(adenine-N6)-methyltransferase [Ruminococcus sp.]